MRIKVKSIFIFLSILLIFVSGCLTPKKFDKNSISDKEADNKVKDIKDDLKEWLIPFNGYKYDNITISKINDEIVVHATSKDLDGEDIYVFIYKNDTLMLKSYSLEALPKDVKEKAINIALRNEEIYKNAEGYVTVKRILPQTSKKFYLPKILFSVTWHSKDKVVSALIDLDEEKVVKTYIG
ncbi:conserved hypothetical protein [Methanocaldococcus sp. FS406-22]|uniref:hypothetical protein n=1 Tax=Methanocaldococcus sp. (strain FS406-22) TaxID=644281 RepID=UPI0001BF47AD|nr:hypothetical protein [Methanocaldococcus sp. FS406-22]ADC69693.1 conserved hypothetical protein [Methanocaldococcus sp. FS406-22]